MSDGGGTGRAVLSTDIALGGAVELHWHRAVKCEPVVLHTHEAHNQHTLSKADHVTGHPLLCRPK